MLVVAPIELSSLNGLINSFNHSLSTSASLLIKAMYFPLECFKPKLFPPEKPAFSLFLINLTLYFSAIFQLWSGELLSTTIISYLFFGKFNFVRDFRQVSRQSFPL